jgi:hypothetical protein
MHTHECIYTDIFAGRFAHVQLRQFIDPRPISVRKQHVDRHWQPSANRGKGPSVRNSASLSVLLYALHSAYIRTYVCMYMRMYVCTYTCISQWFSIRLSLDLYCVDLQVNKAATFSGSNYLQTTTSFNLGSLTAGVSVSCWFKYSGTTTYSKIIDFGYSQFTGLGLGRYATTGNLALIAHLPGNAETLSVADGFPSGMCV